jgi:hypothetical protein
VGGAPAVVGGLVGALVGGEVPVVEVVVPFPAFVPPAPWVFFFA